MLTGNARFYIVQWPILINATNTTFGEISQDVYDMIFGAETIQIYIYNIFIALNPSFAGWMEAA